MFVIVEGCTATGKSTLIKALCSRAKNIGECDVLHKDRPQELKRRWVLRDYVLNHESYEPWDQILISDRWHWGELTYAPIFRPDTNRDGYGLLGVAGWRWVEMFLASRGALVIYLTADNENLARRLEDRGDDHVTSVEDLLRVSSLYERARRDSITVGASLDTSGDTIDDLELAAFADLAINEAATLANDVIKLNSQWPEYVGHPHPDALLVGDRRNVTKVYGEETRLTFMPVDGNSSEFLLGSLQDMFWRQVGMINVNDVRKPVRELWDLLGTPPIVALGTKAAEGLVKAGFELGSFPVVPHPQWARRFANAKQKEYGQVIQTAAETGEAGNSLWTP